MKTWTTPVMQELDVRLTASSGIEGTTEAGGFGLPDNTWHSATYDNSLWEKNSPNDQCVVKKKDLVES